jgi:predicted RNA-binding protein with PUA-like domain
MPNFWLMKSEPDVFSWDDLVARKTAPWDDVRNYQARNNMKAMKIGDQVFFYHSNIGREIVGIMRVVREHYPDPADPRFVLVDVAPVQKFKTPVTLATIKSHPDLQNMALIKQSRLSVMPITKDAWDVIVHLGQGLVNS